MSERAEAVDAWEALYRAQVAVLRQLLAEFPHGEVSFNEYDVLFNLFRQPGHQLRIRDLNRHLLLTQPSVSRLLDRLAVRGLVRKSADPNDARGTIVTMTDAGLDAFRRIGAQHSTSIAKRMGVLDENELRELARLSDKLRAGASPR
jgi:DNA-binding MarR family transcriptional regulator